MPAESFRLLAPGTDARLVGVHLQCERRRAFRSEETRGDDKSDELVEAEQPLQVHVRLGVGRDRLDSGAAPSSPLVHDACQCRVKSSSD